jgi:single-strand DNA-binding protein
VGPPNWGRERKNKIGDYQRIVKEELFMNSLNIIGRLVEDPTLNYTPQGTAVANARIAVNGAGAFISEQEGYQAGFFTLVVWGKQAETFVNYCGKGREIGVEGKLSQRSYENQDGQMRYPVEIIAKHIDYLREPKESNSNQEYDNRDSRSQGNQDYDNRGNNNGGNNNGGNNRNQGNGNNNQRNQGNGGNNNNNNRNGGNNRNQRNGGSNNRGR